VIDMIFKSVLATILAAALLLLSCTKRSQEVEFFEDFNKYPNRVWIGKDYWSLPIEDWQLKDGKLLCLGARPDMRVNLLTYALKRDEGELNVKLQFGLNHETSGIGSAGVRIGLYDEEDPDVRAAVYFGQGIDVGVATNGFLFIGKKMEELPQGFDLFRIGLSVSFRPISAGYELTAEAVDSAGRTAFLRSEPLDNLYGLIALFNRVGDGGGEGSPPQFWFDDWGIVGSKLLVQKENRFGPIFWSMYTLSRGVLKLTAQMPPLGLDDSQKVELQVKEGDEWKSLDIGPIDHDARTATFRIAPWDASRDVPFRIRYEERLTDGTVDLAIHEGTVRRDPLNRTVTLGGLTCQYGLGFPYTPLVKNLKSQNVDILYFSGDQIYEGNGNYGIIRFPADRAILSYLGKWYMFGWAFGDLMRDRPTICTPDDHDVFQGNLWGEGGHKIPIETWNRANDDIGGYVEPAQMVNAVHRTQCAHLPDPFDSTPIEQNISVFYTDLLYGRLSFAIVSDRMFKSHPKRVATWSGRADHVTRPLRDPNSLDGEGLVLLGDRQLAFLEKWIEDWREVDMKVLLSQTPFVNLATHHGAEEQVLFADLDSGGWPQAGRDRAIRLMRKAFVFHIVGDQHIPTLSQYGIEEFRDAGWVFCTPAIYVGYQRRFQPQQLGWKIENPPEHRLPNTGYYRDGLGNRQYVFAVGNPSEEPRQSPRYTRGRDTASGYGVVRFDKLKRQIRVEAYRFQADLTSVSPEDQFPGWPHTISQLENYGREPVAFLPTVRTPGLQDPVVAVENEVTGELVYILRVKGSEFSPPVFHSDRFTIRVGEPGTQKWKTIEGLLPVLQADSESLEITF